MTKTADSLTATENPNRTDPLTHAEFDSLYAELGPRLLVFLERHVGDPSVAEDLLQETFLRVLRKPFQRRSDAETRSYLYRVAASVVNDRGRRISRQRRFAWLWGAPAAVDPPAETGVGEALRRLPERDRTLLVLAYVEGMTHEEIAAVAGVGLASVKVLLSRSRKRFAASLRKLGLDPEAAL